MIRTLTAMDGKQAALDMKSQLEEKLTEDEMDSVNDALDGSMFDMMANSASEVIATALFFGYLEQATQIAQGGGGGNPGTGWGRDDDNDDDKWAKKCFHTACRMMRKPSKRRFCGCRR